MDIQFSRALIIAQLALDSLKNYLNADEIGFIVSRIYILEKGGDVKFTNDQILEILTIYKKVCLESFTPTEPFEVDTRSLAFGVWLAASYKKFKIAETESDITGGINV